MNGDMFPGIYDHAKSRDERFHHFCKNSVGSSSVLASQNAALVMYRVPPIPGAGFSISVRHIKSHTREFLNFSFSIKKSCQGFLDLLLWVVFIGRLSLSVDFEYIYKNQELINKFTV